MSMNWNLSSPKFFTRKSYFTICDVKFNKEKLDTQSKPWSWAHRHDDPEWSWAQILYQKLLVKVLNQTSSVHRHGESE